MFLNKNRQLSIDIIATDNNIQNLSISRLNSNGCFETKSNSSHLSSPTDCAQIYETYSEISKSIVLIKLNEVCRVLQKFSLVSATSRLKVQFESLTFKFNRRSICQLKPWSIFGSISCSKNWVFRHHFLFHIFSYLKNHRF